MGTIVFFVAVGLGILIFAYVFVAPSIDRTGQKWVNCEVYTAQAGRSGSRASSIGVKLTTSCGTMWLAKEGDSTTMDPIAHEFTPHARYDLKLGRISQFDLRMGWSGAEVQAWRKAT